MTASLVVGSFGVLTGQQATFRSQSEAVRVDVLVTDNGQPVPGLQASDFEVLDNGARQDVQLIGLGQLPVNLVLALDVSESVVGDRLARLREACNATVSELRAIDRATLLTFNHRLALRVRSTLDLPRLLATIKELRGEGATSLRDAAFASLQLAGAAGEGRSLVIIFSDGVDRSSWLREEDLLRAAQRADVMAYAVVVGGVASPVLKEMAKGTGGRVFEAGANTDLRSAFLQVLAEFRSRYLLGYSPHDAAAPGWHTVAVRIRGRNVKVTARPGYMRGGGTLR